MGLISIIVPVSQRVNRLVLQAKQLELLASDTSKHDFEFIFVGDAVHQESFQVLNGRAKLDKRYRIISLTRDFGATANIMAGITYASGDCAGFFSERNIDPSKVIAELIRHWDSGAKIVLGKWADPGTKSRKNLFSDNGVMRTLFSKRIHYQDISSVLFDKDIIYMLSQISDPYSNIIEFLAWTGYKPHLVEYTKGAQQGDADILSFEVQQIVLEHGDGLYSPQTFQVSLFSGLILAILGGLFIMGILFAGEYFSLPVSDWLLVVGIVVLIIGVQFALIGLLGEQLFRSLEKLRSRPLFVVDSITNPPISPATEGREKIEKMILSLWSIRKQKISYASSTSMLSSTANSDDQAGTKAG